MVSQRQAHIGQKSAGKDIYFFMAGEFHRMSQSFFRAATVIARNDLNLAPQQAPGCVNFLYSQFPTLTVGRGELGHAGIAVDFADFDRASLGMGTQQRQR